MSFLKHKSLVTYAYDTASLIFPSLNKQKNLAMEMISLHLHEESFFSTQENTKFMRLYHAYYDLESHKQVTITRRDKIGISMIEGHIRHLFKHSKVRDIYIPVELAFMKPYIDKQEYSCYFKFHDDLISFHNISVNEKKQSINTVCEKISREYLHSTVKHWFSQMYHMKMHDLEILEEKKRFNDYVKQVIICQRAAKKWVTRHILKRQIGPNMFRLLDRKERNLRILNSDNTISIKDVKFTFSPVRDVKIEKFEKEQHMINNDLLMDYWVDFIKNITPKFDGSLQDRVYRTIINHAKWNAKILHWKLSYSQHSSSFCLFYHRSDTDLLEIDGQIYRSIGRRKMANLFEKFSVPKSNYPIKPYGSLYNTIARNVHDHQPHNLIHGIIDRKMLSNNQKLFWVKYGNKKKVKDVSIVIKNVHWVRKTDDYKHKVSCNRFRHNKEEGSIDFQIKRDGLYMQDHRVDHEMSKWITDLYNHDDTSILFSKSMM
jgi:hypothetical protein